MKTLAFGIALASTVALGAASAGASPARTAATAKTSSPSGYPMHIGPLHDDPRYAPRGWGQVFADDFTTGAGRADADGGVRDNKWWGYYAGTRIVNSTNGVYDSGRTVSVGNGIMRFHLYSSGGHAYTGVEAPNLPTQTYGRYTVRYRYEPGSNVSGFKSVWMLWPDSNRWGDGEIDFQEFANQANRTSGWAAALQACGYNYGCPQSVANYKINPTTWHTATMLWTPGLIRFYLDGHEVGQSTKQVPSKPMHMLLQTEASDYGPQASPSTVMNIDVDWVTVYKLN